MELVNVILDLLEPIVNNVLPIIIKLEFVDFVQQVEHVEIMEHVHLLESVNVLEIMLGPIVWIVKLDTLEQIVMVTMQRDEDVHSMFSVHSSWQLINCLLIDLLICDSSLSWWGIVSL